MCYDLLMCIYVISAQFIRNNAKQSRKINPIHSLTRWLAGSLFVFVCYLLFLLFVVFTDILYAKTILFKYFVLGNSKRLFIHIPCSTTMVCFHLNTIKLFCMFNLGQFYRCFVFRRKLYFISHLPIKSLDHLRFIMHAVCENNGNYAWNKCTDTQIHTPTPFVHRMCTRTQIHIH